MKKAVRSRHDDLDALEELVNSVTPFSIREENDDDDMPNPLINILVDVLYKDLKRVKEAFQQAKEQTFMTEE